MSLRASHPTHLVWDHDPSDTELKQIVGPDFTSTRMHWREDDQSIRLEPNRLNFWFLMVGVFAMSAMITIWPWLMPWLAGNPRDTAPAGYYPVIGFIWLLLVPVVAWILRRAQRHQKLREPGFVIDKHTRELTLPWSQHVVPCDQIVRFVELRGRLRNGQRHLPYRQLGVVFRAPQQHVFATFARLTTPWFRSSAASRVADYYDLPLQTIKAGTLLVG